MKTLLPTSVVSSTSFQPLADSGAAAVRTSRG
jgi:hypothetical protein